MNKQEYLEFHRLACEKMMTITKAKNADYTGVTENPFANFTRVEALGICSTEQGFLTRMMDKMCRLNSFAQKGMLEVKDESVEDTCLDLANYAILLAAYIKSKRPPAPTEVAFPVSGDIGPLLSASTKAAYSRAP